MNLNIFVQRKQLEKLFLINLFLHSTQQSVKRFEKTKSNNFSRDLRKSKALIMFMPLMMNKKKGN